MLSGDAVPVDEYPDPTLAEAVDQWMWGYRRRDVGTLLRLTMSLSDEHLEIEARSHRAAAESARDSVVGHYVHWVPVDESNPAHVYVYCPVIFMRDGHCVECGTMTEWIRLNGRWYTLPGQQAVHSAAQKALRPNEGWVGTHIDSASEEAAEIIEDIDERTDARPD